MSTDGRIEHRVVIRERDVLEDHLGVVFVEAAPAAVAALHGQFPLDGARGNLVLIALARIVHLVQGEQHLGGVVGVGIELVVEFEVPAARLGFGHLDRPIALVANFLGEKPVGGLDHAGMVPGNAGFAEHIDSLRGVPDRRNGRLHAERGLGHVGGGRLLDAQLFKLVARADDLRIVFGVAQAAQRDDGVEHGRIDGAEAVGHLQPLQHPFLRFAQGHRAQGADVDRLGEMHETVENEKEIPPGDERLAIDANAQNRVGATADEELVNSLLVAESS